MVWVRAETPVPALMHQLSQREPGVPSGAVVLVLGPGSEPWRAEAAGELPWLQVGLVDPVASLGRYMDTSRPPGLSLMAEMAGLEVSRHYRLSRQSTTGELPAVIRPHLSAAPLDSAALSDPAVRAEVVRTGPPSAAAQYVDDAQVVVRLAVAAVTDDAQVMETLAEDRDPLVRARAMDRVSNATLLGKGVADKSSVVRQVAMHRIASLAVAGQWDGRERALEIGAASEDGYLKWKAAWALTAGSRKSVDILVGLLKDADVDVRREAARSLGRRGDEAARPHLIEASRDANSFVRRSALSALGDLGGAASQPVLQAALTDPVMLNAEAAWRGLEAMGLRPSTPMPRFEPPRPFETVAEARAMQVSTDATLRKDLSKYLAGRDQVGGEPVLSWLQVLTQDDDSEVRKGAIEAMGWGQDTGPAIERMLTDPDPDCVITALQALRRSGQATASGVAPLLKRKDQEIRLRAAEALAQSSDPAALEVLEPLIGDRDERIRAAVVSVRPDLLLSSEPSVIVLRAAARTGARPDLKAHPDVLVRAAYPGADVDLAAYALGAIAREDDLLHARFSWNAPQDRPAAYSSLRPPVARPYGHPDRG